MQQKKLRKATLLVCFAKVYYYSLVYLRVSRHSSGHPTQFKLFPKYAPRQPTLRKIKRAAKPIHKTQHIPIAIGTAHLILPQRPQAHPPPHKTDKKILKQHSSKQPILKM
jgi:hypothetical protein